ncbi:hypothetical protein BDR26DRAFT_68952 [Obelidium mucronatum]|nr:hypothetical protein BDR26DRAFT_68952 [Obelidium mucronatum]
MSGSRRCSRFLAALACSGLASAAQGINVKDLFPLIAVPFLPVYDYSSRALTFPPAAMSGSRRCSRFLAALACSGLASAAQGINVKDLFPLIAVPFLPVYDYSSRALTFPPAAMSGSRRCSRFLAALACSGLASAAQGINVKDLFPLIAVPFLPVYDYSSRALTFPPAAMSGSRRCSRFLAALACSGLGELFFFILSFFFLLTCKYYSSFCSSGHKRQRPLSTHRRTVLASVRLLLESANIPSGGDEWEQTL